MRSRLSSFLRRVFGVRKWDAPVTYRVFVDDNAHYMDETERYFEREYATAEEAVAAARRIVDDFLTENYRPGMTADELYSRYTAFGEDPFIVTADPDCTFSAWAYARERCGTLCG